MVELDDTVRQNQLACLPVSRSGHIEAELLDRYPQLEEWKRQAIKARIDSVMGQARAGDDEHKSSSTLKSPATHRRTSMPRSKASNELLFNMDDDPETKSTLITREHNIASSLTATPVLRPLSAKSQTSHDESLHSYEADSFPTFASSQNTPASHLVTTISDEFIASRHHHDNIPTSSVSQGSYEVSPWGQATLKTDKLDMKQIMAQASGNLTSNISTAFALSKTNAGQPRLGKLSQKERKKLQQAHQQETLPSDSPSTSTQSTSKVPPPWQIPIKRPVVSLETILRDKSEIPAVPSATRPLTLRQTVSGKTASAQVTLVRKTSAPQQSMKVDSSTLSSVGEQSKLSASKGKMIQSSPPSEGGVRNNPSTPKYIRHSSMPVEPSLQLSMADILAQQQSEKDIIKEASAKRSLQEIQQEQAFQEWWDQEEAATRARMEQEEVAAKASTRERGGRRDGEGAKSGRGKGRGNEGSSGRRDRRRGRGKGPQSQEKVPKAKDSPA